MNEQDNYLFKVIGSIIMGYGMEKPGEEVLVIANKIIDLVAQATEQRIIKLLEEAQDGDLLFAQNLNTPSKDVAYTIFKGDVIALIKGENK